MSDELTPDSPPEELWQCDEGAVAYLEPFAKSREDAILAQALTDGAVPWQGALAAGLSAGSTRDPEQQKKNLASKFSRRTKRQGRLLPSIASLQTHLSRYRRNETAPDPVTRQEMIAAVDQIIRQGDDRARLAAITAHEKLTSEWPELDARQVIASYVGRVGAENTLRGLTFLGVRCLKFREDIAPLFAGVDDPPKRDEAANDRSRPPPKPPSDPRELDARIGELERELVEAS